MPYNKITVNDQSLKQLYCNDESVYLAYMDGKLVYAADRFPEVTINDNRYNNGNPIYTCKGLNWVTIATAIQDLPDKDVKGAYTFHVNFGPGQLMGGLINSGVSTVLYSYEWIELVFSVVYELDESGEGLGDEKEIAFRVSAKVIGHNPGGYHDLWYKNFPSNGDFSSTVTKIQNTIVAYIAATADHNDLYLHIMGSQDAVGDGNYDEGGIVPANYLTYSGAMNGAYFSSLVTAPNEARYIRMVPAMEKAESFTNSIYVYATSSGEDNNSSLTPFQNTNTLYRMVIHRLPE